jgi:hypothetical protein
MTQPLADVKAAVGTKDGKAFEQPTNFGFNVVQRPAANPYPNQVFQPVSK